MFTEINLAADMLAPTFGFVKFPESNFTTYEKERNHSRLRPIEHSR